RDRRDVGKEPRLLDGAALRRGELAAQRLEAEADAAAVPDHAAQDVEQRPRACEAAAEADPAEAQAAATREGRRRRAALERRLARQVASSLRAGETLEQRRHRVLVGEAVELAVEQLLRDLRRLGDVAQLVAEVGPVDAGEELDEAREVLALLRRRRALDRRV